MDWTKIASIDDILKIASSLPRDPRAIQEYGDKLREDFRRRMQLQDKQKDNQVINNQQRVFQEDNFADDRAVNSQQRQLQDDSFADDKNESNRILQLEANNSAEEEWRHQREMERLSEQGVYASIKSINDFYSYLIRNV